MGQSKKRKWDSEILMKNVQIDEENSTLQSDNALLQCGLHPIGPVIYY